MIEVSISEGIILRSMHNPFSPVPSLFQPYSCVNGVARVNLLVGNKNINKELMKSGCAEHAEENYMSKVRQLSTWTWRERYRNFR